jgi:hypothetical protein
LPDIDQIPAELIKAGGRTICLEIITSTYYLLTYYLYLEEEEIVWRVERVIIVPIHKKGDKTDCNNYRGI